MQKLWLRIGAELFFGACCLATLLMIDPTRASWGINGVPALRYLVVVIVVVSWVLMLLGDGHILLNWQSVSINLFILLVLGGALFTAFAFPENGLMATWMGRGLNALILFPAYHISSSPGGRKFIGQRLFFVLRGAYILMILVLWGNVLNIFYVNLSQVYHTEAIFILSVGWYWLLTVPKQRIWSGLLLLVAAGGLIGVGKFTSYALISMSFGIFLLQRIIRTRFKQTSLWSQRLLTTGFRLFTIVIILTSLFFAFREIAGARSDARDSVVRDYTFALRLGMLRESPYIGKFFIGSPLVTISGISTPIPSHSDWLDIAAFGGILSLGLVLFPAGYLVLKTLQKISSEGGPEKANRLVTFCLYYLILAFTVMVANPILSVTYLALWLWFALGVMLSYVNTHTSTT